MPRRWMSIRCMFHILRCYVACCWSSHPTYPNCSQDGQRHSSTCPNNFRLLGPLWVKPHANATCMCHCSSSITLQAITCHGEINVKSLVDRRPHHVAHWMWDTNCSVLTLICWRRGSMEATVVLRNGVLCTWSRHDYWSMFGGWWLTLKRLHSQSWIEAGSICLGLSSKTKPCCLLDWLVWRLASVKRQGIGGKWETSRFVIAKPSTVFHALKNTVALRSWLESIQKDSSCHQPLFQSCGSITGGKNPNSKAAVDTTPIP